jgi:16S rRNA processing protein RimM
MKMLEYLSIGQIINTHGLRGAVKVYPLTDDISRFEKLKEVYVEENDGIVKYKVESVKFLSSTVSVKLKGVDSEEAANKLRGSYIKVDRKSAVKLPKDTYFICDLIDLEVYDEKGLLLGTVKDVLQTGSNDVYVIQSSGKDILIPALKDIVKKIDLENKKILVEMPEGLI